MTDTENKLAEALRAIQYSMQQAQIPGNDSRREIKLTANTCEQALAAYSASRAQPASVPDGFARVIARLQRCYDCFDDLQGTDIGRDWLDALTTIGALERTQRSPAMWRITPVGESMLAAASSPYSARPTATGNELAKENSNAT